MFGEGTDRENKKKPYFPVTGGSALDNGGHMNTARQSIHGAPNRMVEDTRTTLGNQFVGLRTQWWRTHEQR